MKTQMLSAQRPEDIAAAAGLLRNGKLVAIAALFRLPMQPM